MKVFGLRFKDTWSLEPEIKCWTFLWSDENRKNTGFSMDKCTSKVRLKLFTRIWWQNRATRCQLEGKIECWHPRDDLRENKRYQMAVL